jgi:tungstate transport system substrate-binding protein
VHVIAVGSGKALRMGRDGDVDVVLVHSPQAVKDFVADGFGVNRRAVMYNDFVLVGPPGDPARVLGSEDAVAALVQIAASQDLFVSRGDDSGTHRKETALWRLTGVEPAGVWYREVGQGMGQTLQISDELGAYTLTDRGTWLAYKGRLQARILVQGDQRLHNPYAIIAVNPARFADTAYGEAMQLIAWVTSPAGQAIIRDFRVGGEALFRPQAITE